MISKESLEASAKVQNLINGINRTKKTTVEFYKLNHEILKGKTISFQKAEEVFRIFINRTRLIDRKMCHLAYLRMIDSAKTSQQIEKTRSAWKDYCKAGEIKPEGW